MGSGLGRNLSADDDESVDQRCAVPQVHRAQAPSATVRQVRVATSHEKPPFAPCMSIVAPTVTIASPPLGAGTRNLTTPARYSKSNATLRVAPNTPMSPSKLTKNWPAARSSGSGASAYTISVPSTKAFNAGRSVGPTTTAAPAAAGESRRQPEATPQSSGWRRPSSTVAVSTTSPFAV